MKTVKLTFNHDDAADIFIKNYSQLESQKRDWGVDKIRESSDNPHHVYYWVGKVVRIPTVILQWDWDEWEMSHDQNPFSRDFKDKKEWDAWKIEVSNQPILVEYVDTYGDIDDFETGYYGLRFCDGTTNAAGVQITYDQHNDHGYDDYIGEIIEAYDIYQDLIADADPIPEPGVGGEDYTLPFFGLNDDEITQALKDIVKAYPKQYIEAIRLKLEENENKGKAATDAQQQ